MKSTTKKMRGLVALVTLSLPLLSTAQDNLVQNGGFEANTGKVKKLGQIDFVTGWKSPTGARADIFISDSKMPEIGAPTNVYGTEIPKEGDSYAGIVAFGYQDKVPRTYLTQKLSAPLKKGQKVCVTFYVNLAEGSKYSVSQIGMLISKKEYTTDQKTSIIEKEVSVVHPKNKVFNSYLGWEKICATYTAKEDGEKFITIGNFTPNGEIKPETNKKAKDNKFENFAGAYYYVDDVTVQLLEEKETCDCNYEDAENKKFSTMIYQKSMTNVNLDRLTPKERIEMQCINFAFAKDELTPEAKSALDLIVTELKANPTMVVVMKANVDSDEVSYAEQKPAFADMDARRASMVKDYLKSKGIDASRIKTELKGADEPNTKEIRTEDSDELKQAKNRRVQFFVQ
jgi:outer membrane protein OmpA-like peptidoglycan-associated protein